MSPKQIGQNWIHLPYVTSCISLHWITLHCMLSKITYPIYVMWLFVPLLWAVCTWSVHSLVWNVQYFYIMTQIRWLLNCGTNKVCQISSLRSNPEAVCFPTWPCFHDGHAERLVSINLMCANHQQYFLFFTNPTNLQLRIFLKLKPIRLNPKPKTQNQQWTQNGHYIRYSCYTFEVHKT